MDSLELIKSKLRKRRAEWPSISQETGLSLYWIIKLVNGQIREPSYQKVMRIASYIDSESDIHHDQKAA